MSTYDPPTGPPVAKPPPHPSPPPFREPPGKRMPPPPSGMDASGLYGSGYEITGHGTKGKTVYRVGSTTIGHEPLTSTELDQVIAAVKKLLADQEQAAAASPGSPPPPATVTISQLHELPAYREEPSGLPGGGSRRAY